jgi:hypothetical protein
VRRSICRPLGVLWSPLGCLRCNPLLPQRRTSGRSQAGFYGPVGRDAGCRCGDVPGGPGLGSAAAQWQWGLGNNVSQALVQSGTPKNVNIAQEVNQAVGQLVDAGHFDPVFQHALMQHDGRVTRGLYNLVRNQMLLNHGIDTPPRPCRRPHAPWPPR